VVVVVAAVVLITGGGDGSDCGGDGRGGGRAALVLPQLPDQAVGSGGSRPTSSGFMLSEREYPATFQEEGIVEVKRLSQMSTCDTCPLVIRLPKATGSEPDMLALPRFNDWSSVNPGERG
jgi:hypothetical protein